MARRRLSAAPILHLSPATLDCYSDDNSCCEGRHLCDFHDFGHPTSDSFARVPEASPDNFHLRTSRIPWRCLTYRLQWYWRLHRYHQALKTAFELALSEAPMVTLHSPFLLHFILRKIACATNQLHRCSQEATLSQWAFQWS